MLIDVCMHLFFLVLWVYTQARRGGRRNKHDRIKSSMMKACQISPTEQFARGFERRKFGPWEISSFWITNPGSSAWTSLRAVRPKTKASQPQNCQGCLAMPCTYKDRTKSLLWITYQDRHTGAIIRRDMTWPSSLTRFDIRFDVTEEQPSRRNG